MMDFIEKNSYSEKDLCDLIETQAEESIHLDDNIGETVPS